MSETDLSVSNEQSIPQETPQATEPVGIPPASSAPMPNQRSSSLLKISIIGFCMVFVLGLIGFLILSLGKKSISSGPVNLIYWGLWEDASVIQPLITQYQQTHKGITITYQKVTPQQYRQKILVRGKEKTGPDIFTFHNTWVPMMAEILAPVPKEIYTPESFRKTFYPVIASDVVLDTSILGIPLSIDGLVLLYNKDMFKRAGLVNAPHTWEDVITYANELTVPDQSGNIITGGIALGTANNIENFSDILGWMLLQNGASIADTSSTEAVDVLQSYRQFAESPNNVWDDKMPNDVVAFAQGKVAMIIVPSWQIFTVKSINPEIQVGVAMLPVLPGEDAPLSVASYWIEGVSRSSHHQREAFEFLAYLSSKDALVQRFSLQSKTRLFGSVYPRVDMKELLKDNEYLVPLVAQAPYMKSIPTMSRTFDTGLNDEISTYLQGAVDDAQKGVSYQQAMTRANTGIQQVLTKYKVKIIDTK